MKREIKMKKAEKLKLSKYANKQAAEKGFCRDRRRDCGYYGNTNGGPALLDIDDNTMYSGLPGVCLTITFEKPDHAHGAGFKCNPFSGKYNFHFLENPCKIDAVFKLLRADRLKGGE